MISPLLAGLIAGLCIVVGFGLGFALHALVELWSRR